MMITNFLKLILTVFLSIIFTACVGGPAYVSDVDCPGFSVPVALDNSFVQWMIANGEKMKFDGLYKGHAKLGEEALEIARLGNDKKALVTLLIQLTSTHFYLGDIEQCRRLAQEALTLARTAVYRKEEVQSLYLLSAADRSEGKDSSVTLATEALTLCDSDLPAELELKAKVLFNLGSAELEIKPRNVKEATKHLRLAAELFERVGTKYDRFRTGLKLALAQYYQSTYEVAEKTVINVQAYAESAREKMIYHQLFAKIKHAQKKWGQATENVEIAYKWAKELDAKKDIERISKLIEAIKDKKQLLE